MRDVVEHVWGSSKVTSGRDSRPSILCIDDEPELARIWQIRLARRGVHVTSATNGEQGFAAALDTKPDLIFLDFCMPGGDGSEVLARLRSHPDTREIPVFILTGGNAGAARNRASLREANGYLMKPLNFDELLEKLDEHIPGHQAPRAAYDTSRSTNNTDDLKRRLTQDARVF